MLVELSQIFTEGGQSRILTFPEGNGCHLGYIQALGEP